MKIIQDIKSFPHYERAVKNFEIYPSTVFAYDDTIFSAFPMVDHLVLHECHHLHQQKNFEGGADAWWERYFIDPKFRLDQELEAFRKQIKSIKDRNEANRVLMLCADVLASPMYGNLVTKQEAIQMIKK